MCGTEAESKDPTCSCGYQFKSGISGEVHPSSLTASPQQDGGTSGYISLGWCIIGAGLLLSFYAYAGFDPSVESYSSYSSGRIINNGLLQDQLMLFQAGLALLVSGFVLIACGAVLGRLDRS
jgi:hypothetical protein